jgi:MSHA biogenesis protein MshI
VFRKPPSGNLVVLSLHADRIDIAKIARHGSLPLVELCGTVAKKGTDLETLQAARKEFRLDNSRCATVLAKNQYQMQLLEAPAVAEAELKSAVRWRLKDFLDYPVETATIDVLSVPADQNAPTRGRSVYAIAARNQDIEARMKLFAQARINLEIIDVEETAQRNIATLFEVDQRAVAMLSFSEDSGLLTFSARGELYLSRHIDVSLPQLSQSNAEGREQLFERIALELQRSLDHMDRQYSSMPVGRVLLAPLPTEIGLGEYLKGNLSASVESVNLAEVLDFQDAPLLREPDEQLARWMALGAALRAGANETQGRSA